MGKLQIAMRKNGCLGDVLGQDHGALLTKTFQFFNFDLVLHSGLFYECGSPDRVWTYQLLASISGKLDIARPVNSKMAGDEARSVKMDAWAMCSGKIIERW